MDDREGTADAPANPPGDADGRARPPAGRDGAAGSPAPAHGDRSNGSGGVARRRRGFHRSRAKGKSPRRAVSVRRSAGADETWAVDGHEGDALMRHLLADFCKTVGVRLSGPDNLGEELKLPTRLHQTLQGLIAGDSEKQIAFKLGISQHTVHVYVKQLYKRLKVSSRGELMAKFMRGK